MIFSHIAYELSHLKFLFQDFFEMSHTYDVINRRFKKGTPKQQGMAISILEFSTWLRPLKNFHNWLPHSDTFSFSVENYRKIRKSSLWYSHIIIWSISWSSDSFLWKTKTCQNAEFNYKSFPVVEIRWKLSSLEIAIPCCFWVPILKQRFMTS